MQPKLKTIASQPSWVIQTKQVQLALTRRGGHMAPVTFYRDSTRGIQPYHITPWQDEKLKIDVPVLAVLRGDFFCMPFGGGTHRGVTYPVHGETAGGDWSFVDLATQGGGTTLTLAMKTRTPAGKVTKRVSLVDGQNVVYTSHLLEGYSTKLPLGHHATLAMPDEQQSVHVTTSATALGLTFPSAPGDPAGGEYYALEPGRKFKNLSRVPTIWKSPDSADCSSYPARRGFCDILGVFHKPGRSPAWTAATFARDGFLWFSLKDASVLPCLTIWTENHGRHTSPWLGRNSCLGLEDVCAYLATGVPAALTPNAATQAGIPTAIALSPKVPTAINYIQGVLRVPKGFTRAEKATFSPEGVTFIGDNGKTATAAVNVEFLKTGSVG